MKTRLYTKKVPEYIKKALPDLFKDTSNRSFFGDGSSVVMAFYTDENKLMGACNYTVNSPKKYLNDGTPKLHIYIDMFEVVPKARHTGAGTAMYECLEAKYLPLLEKLALTHRTYDDGVSCKFWTKMGFRHKGGNTYMEKKILKSNRAKTVETYEAPKPHIDPYMCMTEMFE